MTPYIENQLDPSIEDNNTEIIQVPSKTYKLKNDRIIGFVDNIDAVKQTIYHILSTERNQYLIYDDNYGVELEQYIGKDFDYLQSSIEDTLQEALTMDLRILSVQVIEITKASLDTVNIKFIVSSIYGDLQMEVNISV